MENILEKLIKNSKKAIEDGIYDINESLPNSGRDLENIIKKSENYLKNKFYAKVVMELVVIIVILMDWKL